MFIKAMEKTEVRTVIHSTGERIPLLFRLNPYQPLLLPLLWVTLERRYKARSSIDKDLRALKTFYDYCWDTGFDLETASLDRDFDTILARYDRFAFWIKSKKKTDKIAGRIGSINSNSPDEFLGAATVNSYLSSVKLFLIWCVNRYITPLIEKTVLLDEVLQRKNKSDGLEPEQVCEIRRYIHPDNSNNPYPKGVRVRNWLMFNLLLEAGLRRSELLKLQTVDIHSVNERYFVVLVDRTGDPKDSRKDEPGFKTLERTIEITSHLYEALDEYVDYFRRPTDMAGKPKKLLHQYLFTNYRGEPLGAKVINAMFDPLKELLSIPDFTPHKLRNTFANEFLEFLVEHQRIPLEAALDKLRYIAGWSPTSPMPQKYGRQYIAKLANRMNRDRVQSAWDRVRQYE
jgi:site-specific recombinase XerD